MNISIIVAMGPHHQIGLKGKMPWYSKEDLAFFRKKTMNHVIVMGRKTYEGLPKILEGRTVVVLSKSLKKLKGAMVVSSVEEALAFAKNKGESEIFIGGGEEIYKIFLNLAQTIYLTKINYHQAADRFFPSMDEKEWIKVEEVLFSDGAFCKFIKRQQDDGIAG